VHDTAGAARMIAEAGDPGEAAIASVDAAAINGLTVLAERIQTDKENFTKFAVIGTGPQPDLGAPDKTSLVMAVLDEPGSLLHSLEPFAERGINLHKLESRPRRGRPFEYVMYVDVMAAEDDPGLQAALEEVREHTSLLRVLGTYRSASDPV
jgi:prephenate dehydratase